MIRRNLNALKSTKKVRFQGTQQGISGTSGFRGTQVEKHWSSV
jgi:hypothetical protein